MNKIEIGNYEYDTEDSQKGVSFDNLKTPKGAELWTVEDCIKLHNNEELRKKLNLNGCWFWIKQPFKTNQKRNLVAWFRAFADWVYLNCWNDPQDSYAALGVRWKYKAEKVK